jgi:hypothetical protein
MMIPGQVGAWLFRCQQNIERMQREGIDPNEFRHQYAILSQLRKVASGDAVLHGTLHAAPATAKTTESQSP